MSCKQVEEMRITTPTPIIIIIIIIEQQQQQHEIAIFVIVIVRLLTSGTDGLSFDSFVMEGRG